MKIEIDIPAKRIADLMTTAIESGDPVTAAARGGWCVSIKNKSRKAVEGDWWYADPKYFNGSFSFEVVELDDETTGHETTHKIGRAKVARGLSIMAATFGHLFQQITADNIDAPCGDIFLQCVVFGKEKYA